ncbi:hypothetical protein RRG08_036932 [Elysia crispata]|uniref:Uncharacterized protein n=1 Tax=Elysia crispata TaxID=231223 RepID=A0AAE0ZJZ4_9GAST|nr:hypothetical protein RRG08_036932 [Elysia crispata]
MGKYLKKLPVTNKTLAELSYLSPALQRNKDTTSVLSSLAGRLPTVINPLAISEIDEKLRSYCVDQVLAEKEVDEKNKFRLDVDWWKYIFQRRKNGILK